MKAIVIADMNWGIGFEGTLIASIPQDQKRFKEMTLQKIVVMGRKTYESLPPMNRPLPGRINIVMTRDLLFGEDETIPCHSVEELFKVIDSLGFSSELVFVIGGEEIYELLLPYCSDVYLTRLLGEHIVNEYFPVLREDAGWKIVETSPTYVDNNRHAFNYIHYRTNNYIRHNSEILSDSERLILEREP